MTYNGQTVQWGPEIPEESKDSSIASGKFYGMLDTLAIVKDRIKLEYGKTKTKDKIIVAMIMKSDPIRAEFRPVKVGDWSLVAGWSVGHDKWPQLSNSPVGDAENEISDV